MSGRQIGSVFASPTREPAGEAQLVERELADRGIQLQEVHAGDAHEVGPVSWRVLWPSHFIGVGSVPNNASAVLLVVVDGTRILLPGDIEPEAQSALMAEQSPVHADIAKLPHHGSRFQDPGFAEWAGADLAVVSVGQDNDYGHPSDKALAVLRRGGSAVFRTDQRGDIAVLSVDGQPAVTWRRR